MDRLGLGPIAHIWGRDTLGSSCLGPIWIHGVWVPFGQFAPNPVGLIATVYHLVPLGPEVALIASSVLVLRYLVNCKVNIKCKCVKDALLSLVSGAPVEIVAELLRSHVYPEDAVCRQLWLHTAKRQNSEGIRR